MPAPAVVARLEQALRATVRGEVRFDDGSRALYASDASNYRLPPIGVVVPLDRDDIIAAVRVCRDHDVPILTRGGGTSLAGQCCNVAVILDLSKHYHRVLEIDVEKRLVRVEPGIVLDRLQAAVAPYELMFGPDPSTHAYCTLGGMIGNNACGVHSVLAAFQGTGPRTSDQVHEMEVLCYDGTILRVGATSDEYWDEAIRAGDRRGEIYAELRSLRDRYGDAIRQRFPRLPRRVSGYNLDDLLPEKQGHLAQALAGTEGTCVIILEATLKLLRKPKVQRLMVLGYPDVYHAADQVEEIMSFKPIGLEGMDGRLVEFMRGRSIQTEALKALPEGDGWLLVEVGGDSDADCDAQLERIRERMSGGDPAPDVKMYPEPHEAKKMWDVRESGLGATAFVVGMRDTWEGWEDSAVPPSELGGYLRNLRELFRKYGYNPALYGHFGQGCVHTRIEFDLITARGIEHFRAFIDEAADLIIRHGGSFSGEHGDGQSRAELLPRLYGGELMEAFRRFKRIWDPKNRLNPGRIVDPAPITSNLRLGPNYAPAHPDTYFRFPDDQGDFGRAALRCVGVGKCRREDGGTMCPSYMVTRDEQHSTRGRTRLLFEMLQGDLLQRGFREKPVKEALDLCLACKGCKGECPVQVDVATYKAEFLAHYYHRRLRPPQAYAFGLISQWARLGAKLPRVTNFMIRAPGVSRLSKALIGVAAKRQIPAFAPQTFKEWFRQRPAAERRRDGPQLILWPDTFNNYFTPQVARAATLVLEAAGWQVLIPRTHLCCGRPLYDFGFLKTARRWLRQILDELREEIRAGLPVVGLEPSCLVTFRDELRNFFPHDPDALRLGQQSLLLSEFLERHVKNLPRLADQRALVHGHCHHKAVLKFDAEESVLDRLGLDVEIPDTGCCGMAGAFGYKKDHYDVSVACGERVLLPAVRAAADDTLIITDGYSCREQIEQLTGRSPLHLAEVLARAYSGPPASD
jgi:FAD/FMN-containing dehydrogenase/Fe-S oxidoreductase